MAGSYVQTVPGILKIIEMVFTLLVFALPSGATWAVGAGGFVIFTGVICFVVITIWFILHMTNSVPKTRTNFLIEFIIYWIMVVILLISGILAAIEADDADRRARGFEYGYRYGYDYSYWVSYYDRLKAICGATSFFAFAAAIVCVVDAVFQYLENRGAVTTTVA